MRVDLHMHTTLCRHATGTVDEYIAQGQRMGLDIMGFTDHNPMPEWYDTAARMYPEQLPTYVQWITEAQARTRTPRILLGLEADFFPGTEDAVREQIDTYDFDYIIGSVHPFGGWIDFAAPGDPEDLCRKYYSLLEKSAQSRLFDIIAHPDLVKHWAPASESVWKPLAARALDAVAESGAALEYNASGAYKDIQEVYPNPVILAMARERGIPIAFGSDAHDAQHVGRGLDNGLKVLAELGYDSVVAFDKRSRQECPIDLDEPAGVYLDSE